VHNFSSYFCYASDTHTNRIEFVTLVAVVISDMLSAVVYRHKMTIFLSFFKIAIITYVSVDINN